MRKPRLIFMGTPDFALPTLNLLHACGDLDLVAVYTQPPKPAGRGQHLTLSPVHLYAQDHSLPIQTPENFRSDETVSTFKNFNADIAIVIAYGQILPKSILYSPRLGCYNIHASLLPRWRGAAPIQRAILAGDSQTGITLMKMDEGLDTGDMVASASIPILPTMNSQDLHDALGILGAKIMGETLTSILQEESSFLPQPLEGVTYASKILKEETRIHWDNPAEMILQKIRAFSPRPGAWFEWKQERYKILAASLIPSPHMTAVPGHTLDSYLSVACATGTALKIESIQKAGKSILPADLFLKGSPIPPGTSLT